MGRWSQAIAPLFLDWLDAGRRKDWLDVGCGTGALTSAIAASCDPESIISLDSSEGFIDRAKANAQTATTDFRVGSADPLDLPGASRDVVVSALLMNFLTNQERALTEQLRVTRRGGTVGFYVWDYPGHGLEFVDAFWRAAAALDPGAEALDEARRFSFCTPDNLRRLATRAGLSSVECHAIEVPTHFTDFDDYWNPFTFGTGPASGYCASLAPEDRQRLSDNLRDSLPRSFDGAIEMTARAWAVKARVP
jgi:SAM-dependent methyltransferase